MNTSNLKPLHRLALATLIILLAACSTLPTQTKQNSNHLWQSRQQQLKKLTHWHVEGLIQLDNRQQRGVLNIIWSKNNNQQTIRLLTPLGKTLVIIHYTPQQTRITLENGQTIQHANAATLLQQLLGFEVPVKNLTRWISGQNSSPDYRIDQQGRLRQAQADGWKLNISQYQWANSQLTGTIEMPAIIKLQKKSRGSLQLSLSSWNLDSNQACIDFDDDLPATPLLPF